MCQVSMYVRNGEEEKLLKENVTSLKMSENNIKVATLFEGETELDDMILKHIDFSSGKVVMEKI